MNRRTAAALGLAIAFLIVAHFYWHSDDMGYAFSPAVRAAEPYAVGFYYPIWTLYLLKAILWAFGSSWAGILAGVWSILIVLVCSKQWRTPEWVTLIAPPFLLCIGYCHPFEAMALLGLTLIAQGHVGMGLMLLAFKPQLGFVPGLYVAWVHRREWRVFMPLALLVVATTCLDLALTGRLWVIPFYRLVRTTPSLTWNSSLWVNLGWVSLLWLPIGVGALFSQKGVRRQLFVAFALGLLIMPYWAAYSLWPVVTMAGCFYTVEEAPFQTKGKLDNRRTSVL